jgi:hypothetical protein
MSPPFGELPTVSQYSLTPVPVLHVNVPDVDVNVPLLAGVSICAGLSGVAGHATDQNTPSTAIQQDIFVANDGNNAIGEEVGLVFMGCLVCLRSKRIDLRFPL